MKHLSVALTTSLVALAAAVGLAQAERLESDSYVIQFGNFNVTSGEKESTSYKVTDTVGQTFAGPFGQYGSSSYFIGAGFQYIYQIEEFAFSISDVDVDLGSLTPNEAHTASNDLNITTKGAGGYTVYAFEAHPLRLQTDSGVTIPDTTCDGGTCNEVTAQPWTSSTAYGFGYNAQGADVPADFVDATYFRQFADVSIGESIQPVMTDTAVANTEEANITYKAQVDPYQEAGDYQTSVMYVAVPGF